MLLKSATDSPIRLRYNFPIGALVVRSSSIVQYQTLNFRQSPQIQCILSTIPGDLSPIVSRQDGRLLKPTSLEATRCLLAEVASGTVMGTAVETAG
jgi:hypothetical protein